MAKKTHRTKVTLCGSTKFKDVFERKAADLSWDGKIVLKPEVFTHWNGGRLSRRDERFLDELHKDKIAESHEIYVINPYGYIGKSTRSEIEFAMCRRISVRFMQTPSRRNMGWIRAHARHVGADITWHVLPRDADG